MDGQARQDAELQPCPWLVVLTRQVFLPFSIFSPYFSAPGPCDALVSLTGTWMVAACLRRVGDHLGTCAAQSATPFLGAGREALGPC